MAVEQSSNAATVRVYAYQVIATLGPGSMHPEIWQGMVAAGASGFRLNTSHLTLNQLDDWLENLGRAFNLGAMSLPVVLDLQGSKWRLGKLDACNLAEGEVLEFILAESTSRSHTLPVPHADFFSAAPFSSQEIVLNDAKVVLRSEAAGPDWLRARVVRGGPISSQKGITYTASDFRVEAVSVKDRVVLERVKGYAWLRAAVSYVKDGLEMQKYRQLAGDSLHLAAKLERDSALSDASGIAAYADELWLCRGDLGAELGLKAMAEAVAHFHLQLKVLPAPVLMAGQVLEHMAFQPTPTRSEVCYLYDCLATGYKGFVLSDETAVGSFPMEVCRIAAMFIS